MAKKKKDNQKRVPYVLNGALVEEFDFWTFSSVLPSQKFERFLQENKDADVIDLYINSPGGWVSEGSSFFDLIYNSPVPVHGHIVGNCQSAATMIATACHYLEIAPAASYMIHLPSVQAGGDKREIQKALNMLHHYENIAINLYNKKTGIDTKELQRMMENETWLSAKQAVKLGFADAVSKRKIKNLNVTNEHKAVAFAEPKTQSHKTQETMSKPNATLEQIKSLLGMSNTKPDNNAEGKDTNKVQNLDLELEDGTEIYIEAETEEDAIGQEVFVVNEDGEYELAPEGEHTLTDGRVIVVDSSSILTEIREGEGDDDGDEGDAQNKGGDPDPEMSASEKQLERQLKMERARRKKAEGTLAAMQSDLEAIKKSLPSNLGTLTADKQQIPEGNPAVQTAMSEQEAKLKKIAEERQKGVQRVATVKAKKD